jgi:hypothetical protein
MRRIIYTLWGFIFAILALANIPPHVQGASPIAALVSAFMSGAMAMLVLINPHLGKDGASDA